MFVHPSGDVFAEDLEGLDPNACQACGAPTGGDPCARPPAGAPEGTASCADLVHLAERATRLTAYADDTTQPTVARMEALLAAQTGDVDPTGMTDEQLTDALYGRLVGRAAADERACRDCGVPIRDDMPVLQARADVLRAGREASR